MNPTPTPNAFQKGDAVVNLLLRADQFQHDVATCVRLDLRPPDVGDDAEVPDRLRQQRLVHSLHGEGQVQPDLLRTVGGM